MIPSRVCPWHDDYGAVVAFIGPRARVIINKHCLGFDLQSTAKRADPSGRRWSSRASLIIHRKALVTLALERLSPAYIAEQGLTEETIKAALSDLPEVFTGEWGRLIFQAGRIGSPTPSPSLSRIGPPTSYKTAHDIPESWTVAVDG